MNAGTRYDKTETATWTLDDWQKLVGRKVAILAPAATVTDVQFEDGPHSPDAMVCIEFDGGGSWSFSRASGETIWVED